MRAKKASKLRFYWIAFMTGVYTFWYCSKVVTGSFILKNFRPFVTRQMIAWSKHLLGLIQVRVKVFGRDNLKENLERPIIVMCNHSSLYDIPISAVALNTNIRMLAKKELFKIPVFSAALRRGEFVSIDRHNREQSLKDLANAKQKMLDGIILWVAPEGTRSKDGQLAEFKKGGFHLALETRALIVPIVVKDIHKVQAGNDLTLYLNQTIEVEVCEPVDVADYNKDSRAELVETVRTRMLDALSHSKLENEQ
ncbi:1-acyl-sn-glycerol-3-phosphate acyltransferase [Aliikangiella sp. G2MR2-5]|uniref:lysophospholipid acyltransferase family protein n=1 Tax=Aliikangiella sp. G2MR2-5 TaxID=2788943 RepID=UPI0018AAC1EA|nr:lysophospholipid acyltransferase family protein [Aliikangiella sp. G2MR2-5]